MFISILNVFSVLIIFGDNEKQGSRGKSHSGNRRVDFLLLIFVDPDEFDRIYEPLDVKSKKIHVVDSGLTFNLPYPLILRPQRGVDLIISFDFSARPSDSSPPFKVSV